MTALSSMPVVSAGAESTTTPVAATKSTDVPGGSNVLLICVPLAINPTGAGDVDAVKNEPELSVVMNSPD